MYVVTVTFQLRAEASDDFLSVIQENARLSLETEPGCHRFDVSIGENGPETVFLYELYTDRAAFEAHRETSHFKAFDTVSAPWVTEKIVGTYLLTT